MSNHVTIGVYHDKSFVVNIVQPEDLEHHIAYNKKFRPGRMFFLDGKYLFGGCFKKKYQDKIVAEWEDKIAGMEFNTSVPSEKYN